MPAPIMIAMTAACQAGVSVTCISLSRTANAASSGIRCDCEPASKAMSSTTPFAINSMSAENLEGGGSAKNRASRADPDYGLSAPGERQRGVVHAQLAQTPQRLLNDGPRRCPLRRLQSLRCKHPLRQKKCSAHLKTQVDGARISSRWNTWAPAESEDEDVAHTRVNGQLLTATTRSPLHCGLQCFSETREKQRKRNGRESVPQSFRRSSNHFGMLSKKD